MRMKTAFFTMGVRAYAKGAKASPPTIGNGFEEPLVGEICDRCCLQKCKMQAIQICRDVIDLLEQFARNRNWTEAWINDVPFSPRAKEVLRGLKGNVTEIRRLAGPFESLISEMQGRGSSEDGGRRSGYFAVSPTETDTIHFVSNLAYQPFNEWLEGKQLEVDEKIFALRVVTSPGPENALLTQGRPPVRVNVRGKKVRV